MGQGKLTYPFSTKRTIFSANFRWVLEGWVRRAVHGCISREGGWDTGIQVLVGLAPSSQTVGCNIRIKDPLEPPLEIGGNRLKTDTLFYPDPCSISISPLADCRLSH
jgi:hypothetical protein